MISDFPTGLLFTLDVDNDPLDGGQDGLLELRPLNSDQQPARMIDFINGARSDRGLSNVNRGDVRFGINTPGEVYITNKHDGIVRRLVAGRVGDCNGDAELTAADLSCVASIGARNAVLEALNGLPGDLDGDGGVAFADFLVLSANFGAESANYSQGNIDLKDGVNFADFLVLSTNFGQTPGNIAAVPEPHGIMAWLGILTLTVFRRRGRGR
jgi:hypothetical protein